MQEAWPPRRSSGPSPASADPWSLLEPTDVGNVPNTVLPDGDPTQEPMTPGSWPPAVPLKLTANLVPGIMVLTVLVQLLHTRRGLANFTGWFLDQLR